MQTDNQSFFSSFFLLFLFYVLRGQAHFGDGKRCDEMVITSQGLIAGDAATCADEQMGKQTAKLIIK